MVSVFDPIMPPDGLLWLPWVLLSQHHIVLHDNSDDNRVWCHVPSLFFSFVRSLPLLFLTLTDLLTASVNNWESTQLSILHSFSHFIIFHFLMLFYVLLPSWKETQRVLSMTLLTQHEKTLLYVCVCVRVCESSKALSQCFNNRCNGHHDTITGPLFIVLKHRWQAGRLIRDRQVDLRGKHKVFGRLIDVIDVHNTTRLFPPHTNA